MQHQEFTPPEALQDAIKCFWYNRRDSGVVQADFEVLPDGYAEIIFHFGNNCSIFYNGALQQLPSPFMMELLNQPIHFYTQNRLEIIGIRCYPWAVFDLLGLVPGKQGVRIFEHPIAQLQPVLDKLIRTNQIDAAMATIEQYFLDTQLGIATNSVLFKAGAAMRKAKGNLQVTDVAAAAHATVRTLERNFKQSSGHTVKDVTTVMRFEEVRNRLWLQPDTSLSSLANELGYSDQSHLSREFKRYSGTTPAAFARKAKKQAISHHFITFHRPD